MSQNKAIKEYSSEIPREIRDAINGLSEDIRMAIIVLLLKKESVTYTELKRLLDLNSSSLSHHLSLMQDGGLVDNIVDLKESHSYYKATDIARSILESVSNIVLGISTPGIRLRDVGVQNPKDTSGAFNPWTNVQLWTFELEDDSRTSPAQQYPSEEGSSGIPPNKNRHPTR